jgi:hypothetical protein
MILEHQSNSMLTFAFIRLFLCGEMLKAELTSSSFFFYPGLVILKFILDQSKERKTFSNRSELKNASHLENFYLKPHWEAQ